MKEIEGTWEEIARRAEEFKGKRYRLTELPDEATAEKNQPEPNWGMLQALDEIEKIQEGMGETSGEDTLKIIREGRAGAMYGYEPIY